MHRPAQRHLPHIQAKQRHGSSETALPNVVDLDSRATLVDRVLRFLDRYCDQAAADAPLEGTN